MPPRSQAQNRAADARCRKTESHEDQHTHAAIGYGLKGAARAMPPFTPQRHLLHVVARNVVVPVSLVVAAGAGRPQATRPGRPNFWSMPRQSRRPGGSLVSMKNALGFLREVCYPSRLSGVTAPTRQANHIGKNPMNIRLLIVATFSALSFLSSQLYAQNPTAVCLAIVTSATHDVGIQSNSSSFLNTVYSNYCQQDGTTKASSFNAGLSAVVNAIPFSFTGGSADTSTQITNFCKNYQSTYAANSASFDAQSIVVQKALESANQCLEIATRTQNTISYSILTPQMLAIKFGIPTGQTLDIHGISHDDAVSCEGSKAEGTGTVDFSTGTGQSITAKQGTYNVSCTRKAFATQGGTSL